MQDIFHFSDLKKIGQFIRILSQEPSEEAFLQKLSDSGETDLKRSLFVSPIKLLYDLCVDYIPALSFQRPVLLNHE